MFTPEELNSQNKVVYICLYRSDLSVWKGIKNFENLTFGEKFKLARDAQNLFTAVENTELINTLIVLECYCFQYKLIVDGSLEFNMNSRLKFFTIAVGHKSFPFDHHRVIGVKTDWFNKSQLYGICSNSFKISKMNPPYTDNCFHYPDIGIKDRNDAVALCESNHTNLSSEKVVMGNETQYFNYKQIEKDAINCDEARFKLDCEQRLYITQVAVDKYGAKSNSSILFPSDYQASFTVVSKPRIDNIDYVTYILGALGSWIGFSFIGINPVPLLFRVEGQENRGSINHGSCQTNIRMIRRELMHTKRELMKMKLFVHSKHKK